MNTPTHPSDATIESWLDGSLVGPAAAALEDHVAHCAACAARLQEGAELELLLEDLAHDLAHAPGLAERTTHHLLPAADREHVAPLQAGAAAGPGAAPEAVGDADALPPAVAAPLPAPPAANRRPWARALTGLGSVVALAAAALLFLRPGPPNAPLPDYDVVDFRGQAAVRSAGAGAGAPDAARTTPEGGFQIRLAPQAATEGRAVQARVFAVADGRALPLSPEVTIAGGAVEVYQGSLAGTPLAPLGEKTVVVAIGDAGEAFGGADEAALLAGADRSERWIFARRRLMVVERLDPAPP